VVFADWWKQARQYLDSQPPEAIGGEARKIVWVSNLLERKAASWYWDSWKKQVELGVVANRWDEFEAAIKERFRDLKEDVRALQVLERLTYKDDMFGFLTEWDDLCERAGISGPQYQHKLIMAVGPAVQERLQGQRIVETDEEFREQVLTTGRHHER
jgi:hypothetical protein